MSHITLRDRVFQWWWRRARSLTLGVRVIAAAPDGRIALVRHSYTPGWHLPGGGVERGERAPEAAARELTEETGAVAIAPFELVSVHANHVRFPNDHVLVYRTRVDQPAVRAPDAEILEVLWTDARDTPDGTTPATRRRIEEALFDRPPAVDW